MTPQFTLFFLLAALAVSGAVSLILTRHPIRSALSLIVVMVSLAGLYLLLGAEFVAAVQIIVYAGAIMVLFVLVIMLLNAGEEERTNFSRLARTAGIPLTVALAGFLAAVVARSAVLASPGAAPAGPGPLGTGISSTRALATLLFREFVFPFELTSFLILVAILGALVLAPMSRSRDSDESHRDSKSEESGRARREG